jgi:pullulanase
MKDTFLSARLVQEDLIRLVIFSSVPYEKFDVTLVQDRKNETKLIQAKLATLGNLSIADYHLSFPLELGHSYVLLIRDFGMVPLDVSEATGFANFDQEFAYDGDDLGATVGDNETSFALWAPLASSVILKFKLPNEKRWHYQTMERTDKGVFRLALPGSYDGLIYQYVVTNSEISITSTDPYAKASTPNSQESVALDWRKFHPSFNKEALPVLNSYTDAIVYEGNVRDLTIDKHSDIQKKGTYAGLAEKGRHTEKGNPAGFDYIVSLGITHLQLQPIYDFKTMDELDPDAKYNWGYDPIQYFVPEGAFASNVKDPANRIEEVQAMVSAFHSAGVRVVQDVVFNHVYEYLSSPFEKVVPNYYFRKKANGRLANTSYCGDDVASERPMVRKLIVDACKWWIDFYGIDGFRFDLMGILDCETLKEIAKYGQSKDPSFMVYGEGWNMGSECPLPLGNMDNAKLLPNFAFFNDKFREGMKRFLINDHSDEDLTRYAYIASCLDYGSHKAMFASASQSINYLECHDNATFFDYLSATRNDLSNDAKLATCQMALALVLLSFGIPFIHAGEELGQSKWGKDNTYNLPDIYNKFSYRLLDERQGGYEFLKSLIAFRKKRRFLHDYDPRVFTPMVDFESLGDCLHIKISDENELAPYAQLDFYFNPGEKEVPLSFASERGLLLNLEGVATSSKLFKTAVVPPHSFLGVYLAKK